MRNQTRIMLDHLGDVLAFVRVADAQSFTIAAERLDMSRSAIGKCIARLEARLATRLIHRTTRSVTLSEEGRVFYDHALRILAEVEDAEAALARRTEAPRGRLRLDLPVAFGRMHIVPVLHRYLARWPEVDVDVSFSDDYRDLVRDGIDLAIRIGGAEDSQLIRKVLAPHRLVTCAAPSYLAARGAPATPEELVHREAIVFTHAGRPVPWRYRMDGGDREIRVDGRMRLSDVEAVRDAAVAGHGLAQLGAFLVGDDLRQGRLVSVLEPYSPDVPPVCAVYPTRRHLSPKVRALIDEIQAAWSAAPPWA